MTGQELKSPVVQILGSRKITGDGQGNDRYRLLVSDGLQLHSFAMLSTQLNPMYISGQFEDLAIIQLDRYMTSVLNKNEATEKLVIHILIYWREF